MIGYEDYGFIERRDTTPTPVWTREYGDDPDNFTDQNTVWRMPRGFGDAPMVDAVDRMLKRYRDCEIDSSVQYIDVYNNPKRCGYGIWPGISHNRGYHINPCYGGHLDLFRIEKFSYYFMKSQQDRELAGDVLYIASWWSDVSPDDVTVYSNADEIELWCDGELVARQRPDEVSVKHPPFTFERVRRHRRKRPEPPVRSNIRAVAFVDGKAVAEQTVTAPGVPYRLSLYADTMGIAPVADGSDIVAIRCQVLDREGGIVPLMADRHPILFEIEGDGEIVGDSSILANPTCPDAGVATVLVRTTKNAGAIKIKARLYFDSLVDTAYVAARILPGEVIIESI
jgi:beta-galactosidase